jgi:hypothetical protein
VAQEPIDSPKKTGPAVTSAGIAADALAGFHSTVSRLSSSQVVILADRAGVPRRLAAKARAGRLIGAEAYLKLCSALGLDPTTGLVKQHPTPIEPREVSLQDSHSQGVSTASARRTTRAA